MTPRPSRKLPEHPGGYIRKHVIDKLGLSVREAAAALDVSRPALSALLNCSASLTPTMALRFEKAFNAECGVRMEALVEMQTAYDIALARADEGKIKLKPYVVQVEPDAQGKLL